MNTRNDYHQIAAKLDYAALDKKLAQLRNQSPPKTRKHVVDVLAPLAVHLRELRAKGWTYAQLAKELQDAGLPVKAHTLRQHLGGRTKRVRKGEPVPKLP